MVPFLQSHLAQTLSTVLIGSVWVFHGLYSKILNGIPRHRLIVGRVLGTKVAGAATKAIGLLEVILGLWAWTGWQRPGCAVVQTLGIVGMNALEMILAGDLLISAMGMVILNLGFLVAVWHWAIFAPKG